MATNQSSSEHTSLTCIDIDGKKCCLKLAHSSSAAELRTILYNGNYMSSGTQFLNATGYAVHREDEQSFTISDLLTEDKVVKIVTDKIEPPLIPIPERKSKATSDLTISKWGEIFRNCNLFYAIRMDKETPKRAFISLFKFKESVTKFDFHVSDGSQIRTYMKHKEMHSSFLSGHFFDGGIDASTSFIGIGVNAEYLESKATTNTQKKTYLTHCFNFPRATLQLDSSYLEPTTEFIAAIDTVLTTNGYDEQIMKLDEVLSKFGHVYPRSIVLGAHLYHTEIHDNQEKAEEARQRMSRDVSFSTASYKHASIHASSGSETGMQNKFSEKSSLLTFEAVGGDTRLNRDPTLWTNSIADPLLWRIIEQDDYQSVITLLDQQRQERLKPIFLHNIKNKMPLSE